jgi:hypothetical protein
MQFGGLVPLSFLPFPTFPTMPTDSLFDFLYERQQNIRIITGDGNCFYRALAIAVYDDESFHTTIRSTTMNTIQSDAETYLPYFSKNEKRFLTALHANKRTGVWNTEIADIVPQVVPDILDVNLGIVDYDDDTKMLTIHKFGESAERKTVWLLRTDGSHYDLLVDGAVQSS